MSGELKGTIGGAISGAIHSRRSTHTAIAMEAGEQVLAAIDMCIGRHTHRTALHDHSVRRLPRGAFTSTLAESDARQKWSRLQNDI